MLLTEGVDDDEFHGYNPFGVAKMSKSFGREERDLTIISSVINSSRDNTLVPFSRLNSNELNF